MELLCHCELRISPWTLARRRIDLGSSAQSKEDKRKPSLVAGTSPYKVKTSHQGGTNIRQ